MSTTPRVGSAVPGEPAIFRTVLAHQPAVFEAFCRAWSAACESSPQFSKQARFLAVGRTDPEIAEATRRHPKVDATFLGYQPHRVALQYLTGGDLLLLLIKNIKTSTDSVVTIPGKLFEYVGSQRPVLMIGPAGDAARIIEESGRGSVCTEEDISGIAAALLGAFAARGRAAPEPESNLYERRVLAGALARCLAEASGAAGSSGLHARGAEP